MWEGRTSAEEEEAGRPLNTNGPPPGPEQQPNWQQRLQQKGGVSVTLATFVTALGAMLMFGVIAWALTTSTAAGNNTAQVQWLISNPW